MDLKCEDEAELWLEYEDLKPHVVGFTAVTCEANTVLRLAAEIKRRGQALVVVGGNHATLDPAYFNRPEIDYVVIGLGKKSFSDLADRLAANRSGEGIPGVAKTSPGQPLTFTPRRYGHADLMDECAPRYDLVEKWRNNYAIERLGLRMGFVATAEGCTHRCSFCAIPEMTGGRYLTHSPESVIRSIGLLGDIPFIRMVDANTFGDPRASEELCDTIVAAGIRKRFFGDVRVDTIVKHPSLLKKWKEAGLYAVVVGFEELEPERLGGLRKEVRPGRHREGPLHPPRTGAPDRRGFHHRPRLWRGGFPGGGGVHRAKRDPDPRPDRPHPAPGDAPVRIPEGSDHDPRSGLLYVYERRHPDADAGKGILRRLFGPRPAASRQDDNDW